MRSRLVIAACMAAFFALCVASVSAQQEAAGPAPAQNQAAPAGEAAESPAPAQAAQEPVPGEPTDPAEVEGEPEEDERTMGEAFLLKLRQGGLTMVFLGLASVAGVGYAIERLVHLRRGAICPDGLVERADILWRQRRWEELEELPENNDSTLARVLGVVARHRHSDLPTVSEMAGDVASRDLRRHVQKAYPLAVVATVSPLLGLLGTVIGMIGAFDKVAAAGSLGDASLLGGDISKALITTGAGLTIAVPALVLYHYFKSRTNRLALTLEEEVSELLTEWYSAEADVEEPEREVVHES